MRFVPCLVLRRFRDCRHSFVHPPEIPMKRILSLLLLFALIDCSAMPPDTAGSDSSGDRVVLLHGLLRSSASLTELQERLQIEGYQVSNIDYPATEKTIDEITGIIKSDLDECCLSGPGKLHFVTHSMGGIVVRDYIAKFRPSNLGRVVMLSPPNRGSELADWLRDSELVGLVFGPAVRELGTDPQSKPLQLDPVNFELGVIAGDKSWNPVASYVIPGEDDGTVSIERTRVDGMKDFAVLPHTHTFIMNSARVIDEVVYFLRHGVFSTPEAATDQ